jgi:hypothetical protein
MMEMNDEFKMMMKLQSSKKYLKLFHVKLVPNLLGDTSKVHGSGYLMYQTTASGRVHRIKCGSVAARPSWSRMSPIEL